MRFMSSALANASLLVNPNQNVGVTSKGRCSGEEVLGTSYLSEHYYCPQDRGQIFLSGSNLQSRQNFSDLIVDDKISEIVERCRRSVDDDQSARHALLRGWEMMPREIYKRGSCRDQYFTVAAVSWASVMARTGIGCPNDIVAALSIPWACVAT